MRRADAELPLPPCWWPCRLRASAGALRRRPRSRRPRRRRP
ncbi:hypothetical protein ACFSM7_14765 [Clavibacter michiganensis subsp. tessellarius]